MVPFGISLGGLRIRVAVMEDMKGKWLTVVVKDRNNLTKSLYGPRQRKDKLISLLFFSFFVL